MKKEKRKSPPPFSEKHRKHLCEAKKGNTNGFKKGNHPKTEFQKGNHPTMEFRKGDNLNKKNWNWKGNSVGYMALHAWISRKLGKPCKCEMCEKEKLKGGQIHWANKDHEYKRNLTDWLRLCVSCHKIYDLKNNNLFIIKYGKIK